MLEKNNVVIKVVAEVPTVFGSAHFFLFTSSPLLERQGLGFVRGKLSFALFGQMVVPKSEHL